MAQQVRGRAAPWIGSVVLHIVFIALLAAAALRWRTDAPAPQLAIEGDVVRYEDLPSSVKSGKPLRETAPVPTTPAPEPEVQPKPEPPPPPVDDTAQRQAAEAQRLEQERIAVERRQAEEQAVEVQRARDAEAQRLKAAEEQRVKSAEEQKRVAAEAEAKRKADEERKKQEALVAQQKKAEQEKAAREAKQRAEHEADLQRSLADEEEGEAFARSGVVDEYRALLVQAIERNWNKPPSARAGLKCTLYVTQAPGGVVLDVKIGECNGDQAVRDSVANAVLKSSPLPPPRDPRAFQRQLEMNFEPKE